MHDDNDTASMSNAVTALQERGVAVWRPSPHHLKIGDFNFWPSTGRITRDGFRKIGKQGLDALLEMLPAREITIDLKR